MGSRVPLRIPTPSAIGATPAAAPLPHLGEDEASLVSRIRSGDVAAFHIIFRAYYAPLCAFVAGYVHSDAIAEERVQDVFTRVWTHRAQWIVRDGVRQYLYGAARNEALNVIKRSRVETNWQTLAERQLHETGMGQGPLTPDDQLDATELSAMVDRVLAEQPVRRREAFLLRCRHGLTNPEIAQILGISVKGVEAIMHKTLDALRQALDP